MDYEAMSAKERLEQDRLDALERERRLADQEVLAKQEAINYLVTHDAEAAAEYGALLATAKETDTQSSNDAPGEDE